MKKNVIDDDKMPTLGEDALFSPEEKVPVEVKMTNIDKNSFFHFYSHSWFLFNILLSKLKT